MTLLAPLRHAFTFFAARAPRRIARTSGTGERDQAAHAAESSPANDVPAHRIEPHDEARLAAEVVRRRVRHFKREFLADPRTD